MAEPTHTDIRDIIHEHNAAVIKEIGDVKTDIAKLDGKVDVLATKQDGIATSVAQNTDNIKVLKEDGETARAWLNDQRRALSWGRKLVVTLIAVGGFAIAALEFLKRQS